MIERDRYEYWIPTYYACEIEYPNEDNGSTPEECEAVRLFVDNLPPLADGETGNWSQEEETSQWCRNDVTGNFAECELWLYVILAPESASQHEA